MSFHMKKQLANFIAPVVMILCIMFSSGLQAKEGIWLVNGIVPPPANSIAEASMTAKKMAMEQALKMRGNENLPDDLKMEMIEKADELVSFRHVLNADAVNGMFQPAFYAEVQMASVNEGITDNNEELIAQYGYPQIGVAIAVRRLPDDMATEDDKRQYTSLIDAKVSESYQREGFQTTGLFGSQSEVALQTNDFNELKRGVLSIPGNSASFFLMGLIDVPEDAVSSMDNGAVHRAVAEINVELINLNSNEVVKAARAVEGVGKTRKDAVRAALLQAAKHVVQKASSQDVLRKWEMAIKTGFQADVWFCEKDNNYRFYRKLMGDLRQMADMKGPLNSEGNLFRATFPAGKVVDVGTELGSLVGAWGVSEEYSDVKLAPVVVDGRRAYIFGNDNQLCFP